MRRIAMVWIAVILGSVAVLALWYLVMWWWLAEAGIGIAATVHVASIILLPVLMTADAEDESPGDGEGPRLVDTRHASEREDYEHLEAQARGLSDRQLELLTRELTNERRRRHHAGTCVIAGARVDVKG
jgi:hypothetical protein